MGEKVYSEFLKLSVDLDELGDVIATAAGVRYRLEPLSVKCTYPVFRGVADGVPPVFVKIATDAEWRRTVRVLDEAGGCGLFARFVVRERVDYRGFAVFVMAWRTASVIRPEDMSEAQADRFVGSCALLSRTIQGVSGVSATGEWAVDPERLYETVRRYAARHSVAARFLGALLKLPASVRTYGERPLSVVHGDFHCKNFGFDEDGRMVVFDFDKMTRGLGCYDLANALLERFSCHGLSGSARRRLMRMTRRIVAKAPWPREDFVVVCNIVRMQFAVRRINKHPDSVWVALDILRRDRKLRQFLDCMPS